MRKSLVALGIATACASALVGGVADASQGSGVLSGDGYHGLKLGLSDEGALSTGQLNAMSGSDPWCNRYSLVERPTDGRAVAISHRFGIVELRVPHAVRTPEGIRAGSTVAELKATYPGASSYRNGFTARVPGYADRFYDFWVEGYEPFAETAKVVQVGLDSISYDC